MHTVCVAKNLTPPNFVIIEIGVLPNAVASFVFDLVFIIFQLLR